MPDYTPDPVAQRTAILHQLSLAPSDTDPETMSQLPPLADAPLPSKPGAKVGKLAPLMYLGGAAADIGTTAYAGAHPELRMHEANPLINWAPKNAQLPIGAAIEAGAAYLGSKALKNHPTLLKTLLMGTGIAHGSFALNNLRQIIQNGSK